MQDASGSNAPLDLVEVGRIVSAYGVKGWVKVQPYSAQGNALLDAGVWWLKAPATVDSAGALPYPRRAKVVQCRRQGAAIVARLDALADRTEAERMKGAVACVSRASFPLCDPDEYYWVDLIGCQLWGEREGVPALVGRIVDVIDNGAHALLRVSRVTPGEGGGGASSPDRACPHDEKQNAATVLVPFVSAHVHTVDLANKRLDSNWPVDF